MNYSATANGETVFAVRSVLRAQENTTQEELGDARKVHRCAPPVDGADKAAVPWSRGRIVTGATGRNKRIGIAGLASEETTRRLLG